jgi:hypothetical protein
MEIVREELSVVASGRSVVRQGSAEQLGAPVSDLGTDIHPPFHGLQEFAELLHHAFTRFSPWRYSTSLNAWTGRRPCPAYPEASGRINATDEWYRNINLFPC